MKSNGCLVCGLDSPINYFNNNKEYCLIHAPEESVDHYIDLMKSFSIKPEEVVPPDKIPKWFKNKQEINK